MIRLVLAALLTLCAGAAHAEPRRDLILDRPGDPSPVVLPLPTGVTIVACGGEAILNFYCLRTAADNEAAVLSELSTGILAQGWGSMGQDTKSRPFTYIFERAQRGAGCPLLIMITSDTKTQPGRPALAEGSVEIQLAKTADIRCVFD